MADNNIAGYLQKNWLYAFIINVIITFVSVQIVNSGIKRSLEGNQAVLLVSILGAFWSFCLTVSSATIFLTAYAKIRKDKIYVFFCYFTLPGVVAVIAWANLGPPDMLPIFFSVTIPFFTTQTIFFIRFLKIADEFQ